MPAAISRLIERGERGEVATMQELLAGLDKPTRQIKAMLIGPAIAVGVLIGLGSAYALAG
jgi:hypothetical protein